MSKVILDDETLAKLNGFVRQVEVYNRAGELVGYCVPLDAHLHAMDLGGPDPFSDEQAAAAVRAGLTGRTTAEVLRDLRNL